MDRFGRILQVEVPQDNGGSRDGSRGAFEKPMEAQNEGVQGDDPKISDDEPGQFAGLKVQRRAALAGNCKGDYVGVSSDPFLDKILRKQDIFMTFNGLKKIFYIQWLVSFTLRATMLLLKEYDDVKSSRSCS